MAGSDEVINNLRDYVTRLRASLYALGDHYAQQMEVEAKNPDFPLRPLRKDEIDPQTGKRGTWVPSGKGPYKWRTRTGNARQGIFALAQERDSQLVVRVAHSEQYGVYLELAHQGRYGVLQRTVNKYAPRFYEDVERVVRS